MEVQNATFLMTIYLSLIEKSLSLVEVPGEIT
jgi:hypothetical protein